MERRPQQSNLRTLLWRLTYRVRVVGGLIFMSVILLNTAIFLRSSHSAICGVFESKANGVSGPLGRELLLGDKKTVLAIFNEFKKDFINLRASEHLNLVISKSDVLDGPVCTPRVFSAKVNFPVRFGTEELGLITGEISYLSFLTIGLTLLAGTLIVFFGVRMLTSYLSKELEEAVVKPMRQLSQGDSLNKSGLVPSEIMEIETNLQELKNDIREKERVTFDLIRKKELGEQAERLSHDIISPLNALNSVVDDLDALDDTHRKTLKLAVSRIQDITRNLLKHGRKSYTENRHVKISVLVDELLSEKKIEYKECQNITFNSQSSLRSDHVVPVENSVELKRILSNLINNSVDAISGSGEISIACSFDDETLSISVMDTGQGIPKEILPTLMQKGQTYKKGGSGLGLFYAKKIIESWNGQMKIKSSEGAGTTVDIAIPMGSSRTSNSTSTPSCVLIDNDELTRLVWEDAAKKDGIELKTYQSSALFFEDEESLNRNITVYIDSDLGETIRGEYIAKNIKALGFEKIYLATGFPKEMFQELPWLSDILSKTPAWRNKGAQNAAS